jgi:type II secretory pathway component PulF
VTGIRSGEVALFFRRLHTMLHSGISLPDSLSYLEKGEANPAFRKVLGSCLDILLKGHPLSLGMKKHSEVFSVLSIEMVTNGENTGHLSNTLGQLAMLQERSLDRVQRIKGALAYPTCLLLVMLVVVGLFVTFVAPGDEGLFSTLGDDVPWPSQVLMSLSAFVTNPALMLGSGALVTGLVLLFRRAYHESAEFRLRVDEQCLALPVVGPLLARLDAARTLDVLATSLEVGLSIVQAMKNSIRVVANERFRQDLLEANQAIIAGDGLGVALARNTRIPRFATSMIEVGEESGKLDHILKRSSLILDEDVNDALARLVLLAEPLLLSLGGLAAGFVAVATFLPIMKLISNL